MNSIKKSQAVGFRNVFDSISKIPRQVPPSMRDKQNTAKKIEPKNEPDTQTGAIGTVLKLAEKDRMESSLKRHCRDSIGSEYDLVPEYNVEANAMRHDKSQFQEAQHFELQSDNSGQGTGNNEEAIYGFDWEAKMQKCASEESYIEESESDVENEPVDC